eukprot:gene1593-1740_t
MEAASAVLQRHPAEGCKATKEDLLNKKKNPLDVDDFCPICLEDCNVRCRVANHPSSDQSAGVLSSVEEIDKPVYLCCMVQDVDDDNIITIPNCELLIDSGNTACDLVLTYHDARKFNLRVTKYIKEINQADGKLAVARMIPDVLVKFALVSVDGKITERSAYLDVWVKLKEVPMEALPRAFRDKLAAEKAKCKDDATEKDDTPINYPSVVTSTPEKRSSTNLPLNDTTSIPVNNPSPVKHMAHGSANLGKSGAKKLRLKYDFSTNEISFLEDCVIEFPEL